MNDPALEAVPPITDPLPAYGYDRLDYAMTISVEVTPGGRLWACWVGGGDSEKGFFVLASSDDRGATWSPPRLVLDPHRADLGQARRTLVGTLWCDPLGRLWLFYDQAMGYFDGRGGVWCIRCDQPDVDCPVWTAPQRIWHGCTLNKPIVAADGTWLLPVSLWDRSRCPSGFSDLDPLRMAHVFASVDQGGTWTRRGGMAFPAPEFDEQQIVERRDGSLWMTARTRLGIHESISTDGGVSWSAPWPSSIRQVIDRNGVSSRHHLRRLSSGRLLLIKHGVTIDRAPDGRSHLTAFLSEDDGMTWLGGLLLDARATVSYPDAGQAADGTIFATWDRNRATDAEILLCRFTEADVLAGRCVEPGSRLGMTVFARLRRGQGAPT